MKKSDMKFTALLTVACLFLVTLMGNTVTATAVFFLLNINASAGEATEVVQTEQVVVENNVPYYDGTYFQSTTDFDSASDEVGAGSSLESNVQNTEKPETESVNDTLADELIDKGALKIFCDAVRQIKDKGVAGYTKKHWQTVSSPLMLDQFEGLSGMLTDIMTEVMITEEEMEHGRLIMEKGSNEAKESLPDYNATEETIQSVTQRQDGEATIITIVMKDSLNPSRSDTDGVSLMSQDLLYIEDVRDKIQRDAVIGTLIKELSQGDILYKALTVEATITNDGKMSQIIHYCDSYVEATAQTIFGQISGNCGIGFHAKFYDFIY